MHEGREVTRRCQASAGAPVAEQRGALVGGLDPAPQQRRLPGVHLASYVVVDAVVVAAPAGLARADEHPDP